jgi:hypothetical protein
MRSEDSAAGGHDCLSTFEPCRHSMRGARLSGRLLLQRQGSRRGLLSLLLSAPKRTMPASSEVRSDNLNRTAEEAARAA